MPPAPPPLPDDPEQTMRETRQRFIAAFPTQCDSIALLVNSVAALGARGPMGALRQVLHRMTGLAGTIGFPTVSQRAGELEMLIAVADRNPLDVDRARTNIDAIREAFARDLTSPPRWVEHAVSSAAAGVKILVVEDDPEQRAVVTSYLRGAGHLPVEVSRGDQAVDAARSELPALILLDVELPGMNGYSICRLLKSDPELALIPVIFMTPRASLDDKLAGLTLGADEYLSKPVEMRELVLRIQLLQRRTAARSIADEAAPSRILTYDAFVLVGREQLAHSPVVLAMLRVPIDRREAVVTAIREEVGRRDTIGQYGEGHIVLLLPQGPILAARDRLIDVINRLKAAGITGIHAGLAAAVAQGTTIETLVVEADEALAEARYLGEPAAVKTDRPRPSQKTPRAYAVVLAGDDTRIVDSHMKAAGYRTFVAFDGEQAIAAVQTQKPDVLLLDLMMPKMTGFDVLAALRNAHARPRIVVLSARGREDDVTRAFELGADDYLTKPFSPQELLARVALLLR